MQFPAIHKGKSAVNKIGFFLTAKCLSGNFSLKILDESRHGLPNILLSGTSFNFAVWKSESNQTHVSGRTLSKKATAILAGSRFATKVRYNAKAIGVGGQKLAA